ncbi:hypothetical protein [Maridesulfovibrio sp.]|uniref:hypothetical protein n=1 Tax=Maridesulfovibrio sp. TaxID=2795000 RepID=UPI0029F585F2|nr:hypothetical protein [Maridesulfovibrio sp.]
MLSKRDIESILNKDWEITAIVFYGRSGSFFLGNLLDGHHQLITPSPIICQYLYPVMQLGFDDPEHPNVCFSQDIKKITQRLLTYDECCGSYFSQPHVQELIDRIVHKCDCLSRRDLLLLLVVVIHMNERNLDSIEDLPNKIIFQLHTPGAVGITSLLQDFRNVTFIYMVRKPLESYISHMWHHLNDGCHKSRLAGFICFSAVPFIPALQEITKAVRIEELKSKPREMMDKLARLIGVDWDNIFLVPTVGGNVEDNIFNGFDRFVARLGGLDMLSNIPPEELPWFKTESTRNDKEPMFSAAESEAIEIALSSYYKKWNYTPEWIVAPMSEANNKKALEVFKTPFSMPPLKHLPPETDGRDQFRLKISMCDMFNRKPDPIELFTTDEKLFF